MSAAEAVVPHDCPRCGSKMTHAHAKGLFALFRHPDEAAEGLLESARPEAYVCPGCGYVELRVQNPTRFS